MFFPIHHPIELMGFREHLQETMFFFQKWIRCFLLNQSTDPSDLAEDICLATSLMTIPVGTTAFPWVDVLIPRERTPPRDPALL